MACGLHIISGYDGFVRCDPMEHVDSCSRTSGCGHKELMDRNTVRNAPDLPRHFYREPRKPRRYPDLALEARMQAHRMRAHRLKEVLCTVLWCGASPAHKSKLDNEELPLCRSKN